MSPANFSDLRQRILSGAILAVAGLAALLLGGLFAASFVALAGGLGGWEYRRLSGPGEPSASARVYGALVAIAAIAAHLSGIEASFAILAAAGLGFAAFDAARGHSAFWGGAGMLTLGVAASCFVALRDLEGFGLATALWIAALVIATDIGAYFAGRILGGPKLWPRVSPKKTWAGLGGGMAAAAASGTIFAVIVEGASVGHVATLSALAAVVAQGGDLAESALKRRFGAKDSSALIPGHGGVLDRIDGFCAATLAVAAATYARGGPAFV